VFGVGGHNNCSTLFSHILKRNAMQTQSLKELLDAFQKSVNRDRQPEEVAAKCFDCRGEGLNAIGGTCSSCQGSGMVVVTR